MDHVKSGKCFCINLAQPTCKACTFVAGCWSHAYLVEILGLSLCFALLQSHWQYGRWLCMMQRRDGHAARQLPKVSSPRKPPFASMVPACLHTVKRSLMPVLGPPSRALAGSCLDTSSCTQEASPLDSQCLSYHVNGAQSSGQSWPTSCQLRDIEATSSALPR